jgi:ABC-type multidrug transport system fused ATPase/permease subunit
LIRHFWQDFLRQYRSRFVVVGGLMVLSVLLQLPSPLLTMFIIDSAVQKQQMGLINQLALAFAALVVFRHFSSYLNEAITLRLKESIILDVESNLFRHLQSLPLSFFAQRQSPYLQTRLMNDARAIEGALVRTVVTMAMDGLTFLVGAVIVLFIRFELGLVLLVSLVPFAFIRYYANRRMRELSKEMQERQATVSAVVSESFAGVRTIKALGREAFQEGVVSARFSELRDIYVRTNWFGILSGLGTSLITSLCIAFVLWYGMRQVIAREMSLGQVVGILSLMNFLYGPITNFVAANLSIQRAAAALHRIYEFLIERPEISAGESLGVVGGAIEFRAVSFGYTQGNDVLHRVNFSIAAGETVALVGRSGAGKSTLVNLLLRFYETDRGSILLDGKNVRGISLSDLRASIMIVDQQSFLFSGTIADNVRLGRPDASFEEIVAACRKAYSHDFIEELPDGYDTAVGERGVRLSGGQCQRIALARIFLRDPRIVILDEAVSAVDSESEIYIQEALRALAAGRTTIIIAHRLSSLLLAERVVLLEGGVVMEDGTHARLLRAEGAYAKLFRQQFQPQIANESPVTASVA